MGQVVDLGKWRACGKDKPRDPSRPVVFQMRDGGWCLAIDNPAVVIMASSREECIALWMRSKRG